MYSDNGTNCRGATTELKEFILKLDKDAITNFASMNRILWSFKSGTYMRSATKLYKLEDNGNELRSDFVKVGSVNNVPVRTAPQPHCLYKVRSGNSTSPVGVLVDVISKVPPEEIGLKSR